MLCYIGATDRASTEATLVITGDLDVRFYRCLSCHGLEAKLFEVAIAFNAV